MLTRHQVGIDVHLLPGGQQLVGGRCEVQVYLSTLDGCQDHP